MLTLAGTPTEFCYNVVRMINKATGSLPKELYILSEVITGEITCKKISIICYMLIFFIIIISLLPPLFAAWQTVHCWKLKMKIWKKKQLEYISFYRLLYIKAEARWLMLRQDGSFKLPTSRKFIALL